MAGPGRPTEGGEYSIRRISTGSAELDALLSGGFPEQSLILVTGNPGTGKTIFTAGFLYEGAARKGEKGVYVSFSEGRQSFIEEMKTLGLDFEREEREGRFKFIEMLSLTREATGRFTGELLETIRTFGAKRLVIDSYSSMAQAIGSEYEGRQVLHTVLGRIVRNMGCTTLVIGEQPTGEERIGEAGEEFVADGVLNLKLMIPRELEIRKMRGTRLTTREAIYTIDGGFRVLRTELQKPARPKKWVPIPDKDYLVSTGSADLDAIIGGGFPRGSYVVLECSLDVTLLEMRLLTRGLALNFLNQRRGVIMVPTGGVDTGEVRRSYLPYTTKELFDGYMRISEEQEQDRAKGGSHPPYVIPSIYAEGSGGEQELEESSATFYEAYTALKQKTKNQPVLRSIGYDMLESSYARFPERLFNEIGIEIARTKAAGNITIGLARPTLTLLDRVLGMVDWHIRLTKKNGLLMVQGVKPQTNVYGVECDISHGYPVMKLRVLD
ncbi:MAG: ATPase domain-containing protein [Nitrososphaerales archaeon]|jgi:KaiC/GvpD/RAD55 family RecA-like ATPase